MISRERMQARLLASMQIDSAGCWIWQKTKMSSGYGNFAFGKGNNVGAHRVAYIAFIGEIPDGLDVCHECDVRDCVNPDHLFIGTRSVNILDAVRKGRWSRKACHGEEHPSAKLKDNDIQTIVDRLATGETKASIARDYNVTARVITLIQRGEAWKHIERRAA